MSVHTQTSQPRGGAGRTEPSSHKCSPKWLPKQCQGLFPQCPRKNKKKGRPLAQCRVCDRPSNSSKRDDADAQISLSIFLLSSRSAPCNDNCMAHSSSSGKNVVHEAFSHFLYTAKRRSREETRTPVLRTTRAHHTRGLKKVS